MKQKIIAGILALTLSGVFLAAPAYAAETIDGEHFDTDYYIATHQYSDAETEPCFTVGKKSYGSLQEAIEAANGKQTIILSADITDTMVFPDSATAVIDGQGKYFIHDVTIHDNANVILQNLTFDGFQISSAGVLKMENCIISNRKRGTRDRINITAGQFIMKHCSFNEEALEGIALRNNAEGIISDSSFVCQTHLYTGSTASFTNCTFNHSSILAEDSTNLVVQNSSFTGEKMTCFIGGWSASEITVQDTNFTTTGSPMSVRSVIELSQCKKISLENIEIDGKSTYNMNVSGNEINIQNCNFGPSIRGINVTYCDNLTFSHNQLKQADEITLQFFILTDIESLPTETMQSFFENNTIAGLIIAGKDKYYLDQENHLVFGWQKSSEDWYYFSKNGAAQKGWFHDQDGKWYYLNPDTAIMETGWVKVDGKWYLLGGGGAMKTGWQQSGGKWYYLTDSGAMAENHWIQTGDKWYYVGSDGAMLTNTKVNGYKLDKNGVWIS